ncbi:hypothetical protein EAI_00712 [Harpegnathos saltator]|uniref:C2H2-type domain-containing protein n=2 Tax=Harpegnathos saltator TaxID=610380 RepID=E2B421_HARSA|nr:hypothetical protein EAI_00712 [Harpegnathos saltator]
MPDEESEEANLLPSKKENIRSEITLFPIKPKSCGCSEPCEIITCEITIPLYVDEDEVPFILAMNIKEEEIDTLVTKHCDDEYCDALSIDHDRCRRGLIKLYRCDKFNTCDICRTPLNWQSRLHHQECEMKDKYRHNNVSKECLLKDRLCLQEMQILKDSKVRRKVYLDPIKGPALALEAIQNNKELVVKVLPTTTPDQKSIVPTTTVSDNHQLTCITSSDINQSVAANSQMSSPKNIVSSLIAIPLNKPALSSNGTSLRLKENIAQQTNSILLSNAQPNTYIVTSSGKACTAGVLPQNQYICLANSTATILPTTTNNLIVPQSHIVTSSSTQPKPQLLTPIRVVPITKLRTAPSLLHRQQGLPKFCVMTSNAITTLTVPSVQTFQPVVAADVTTQEQIRKQALKIRPKILTDMSKVSTSTQERYSFQRYLKRPGKRFFCIYCCKYFSTDWYFKKHIEKHVKQKDTPRISSRSVGVKNNMKKQPNKKCDVQKELCHGDSACDSPTSLNSSVDRTNSELKAPQPPIKLEYVDVDCCDEDSVGETNDHMASVNESNEVGGKRIKCEETFDTWNENLEISKNDINIEVQDDVDPLKDISVQEYDVEESLIFNRNCNAKENEFTIVSVEEITKSENLMKKKVNAPR